MIEHPLPPELLAAFVLDGWAYELEHPNFRRSVLQTARDLRMEVADFERLFAYIHACKSGDLPRGGLGQLFFAGKNYRPQREFILDAIGRTAKAPKTSAKWALDGGLPSANSDAAAWS